MSSTSPNVIATPDFFWEMPPELVPVVDHAAEIEAEELAADLQKGSEASCKTPHLPDRKYYSPAERAWGGVYPAYKTIIEAGNREPLSLDLVRNLAELTVDCVGKDGRAVERPANHFAVIRRATYRNVAENGHRITTAIERWCRLPADEDRMSEERLLSFDEQCARDAVNRVRSAEALATVYIASSPNAQPEFPRYAGEMHAFDKQAAITVRTDGVHMQAQYPQTRRFASLLTIPPTLGRVEALCGYIAQLRLSP